MKIYINDISVKITSKKSTPKKKFDVFLNDEKEDIPIEKLKGKVLMMDKSHSTIEGLLKMITLKKHDKIKSIDIQVQNKPKTIKYLKSKFDIIKAAGGIVEKQDKILLILRNNLWDIPKGKLEMDENKEEGAVREVEEETGVLVALGPKICSTWHTYVRKKKYVLKKTYWHKMTCLDDANMKPQKEENIQKVAWMTDHEVDLALLHSYNTINKVVKKYRKLKNASIN